MKKQKIKIEKNVPPIASDRSDARVGSVCVSMAGHDEGVCFIVIAGVDRDHVYVADGKARKLIAPKKKKMRHLSIITRLPEQIAEVLKKGDYNDSFLRKTISTVLPES